MLVSRLMVRVMVADSIGQPWLSLRVTPLTSQVATEESEVSVTVIFVPAGTLPLVAPAQNSIIILSLIGGLRTFDLIWAMTGGGPGFATDVLASVIYKQYAAGFYGLSTAGNVVMLILISIIAFPLQHFLNKREEAIR